MVEKLKPKLDNMKKKYLKLRVERKRKKPEFRHQEWFRYKRLANIGWRRPRGVHSKLRRHFKYRGNVVSIGYRSPKAVRGLHPSGFKEIIVHNVNDLKKVNPSVNAVRIASNVGMKKRLKIEAKADDLKIRVLNRVG